MSENRSLPAFDSTEDLIEFFDNNDMGEFNLCQAEFEVDTQNRQYLLPVDETLMMKIIRSAEEKLEAH